MTLCKSCGAVEGGVTLHFDSTNECEYETCNECGEEDSVIEVNEDDFKEDQLQAQAERSNKEREER